MAAETKLSIINQARTAAGEERVGDLTPVDATMRAALESYEAYVLEEMEEAEWAFSLKTDGAVLAPTLDPLPSDQYLAYAFLVPDDSVGIVGVSYLQRVLDGQDFRIEGNKVLCRYGSDVTLLYKTRPGEEFWPRRFTRIIVEKLTGLFLKLTERHSEGIATMQGAMVLARIGRAAEARQRRNRPMGSGSIVERRRGY